MRKTNIGYIVPRLSNANLNFNTKFPVLLHDDHHLTELIVKDSHERVLHNGFNHTLAEVRKNYWIVRGRNYVKKILRKCIICKRFNARCYRYPSSSTLPRSRVNEGNHLGPLVSIILDHSIIKLISSHCFTLLQMIKQKCSSVIYIHVQLREVSY